MDASRRKWRISIRAVLGVMLGVGVGLGLILASYDLRSAAGLVTGIYILAGTLGALVARLSGHHPAKGFFWGAVAISVGQLAFGAYAIFFWPLE